MLFNGKLKVEKARRTCSKEYMFCSVLVEFVFDAARAVRAFVRSFVSDAVDLARLIDIFLLPRQTFIERFCCFAVVRYSA